MQTLQQLTEHIALVWKFVPERYPDLAGESAEQRESFLIKHLLLHLTKNMGEIAALCEEFDHRQRINRRQRLQIATIKMFVSVLKLAEESGLSAADLLSQAPGFVR